MGCLLALLSAFAPRLVFIMIWIARPEYVDAVFGSVLWPILGLIFLPFTTLVWLFLDQPPFGVTGFDWFWIGLAVILDLGHYGNTYGQRDTITRGVSAGPPPSTGTPMTNR